MIAYRFFLVADDGVIRSEQGDLTWPAPVDGQPGAWVEHEGPIALCRSGLHASPTILDALRCRQGSVLARVEAEGIEARDEQKFAARRMRIVDLYSREHLVGLGALAAAMVLDLYERRYPEDDRPRRAILAALSGDRADDAAAYAHAYAASYADAAAFSADDAAAYAHAYAASYADAAADARTKWRQRYSALAESLLALPAGEIGGFVRGHMPARTESP